MCGVKAKLFIAEIVRLHRLPTRMFYVRGVVLDFSIVQVEHYMTYIQVYYQF